MSHFDSLTSEATATTAESTSIASTEPTAETASVSSTESTSITESAAASTETTSITESTTRLEAVSSSHFALLTCGSRTFSYNWSWSKELSWSCLLRVSIKLITSLETLGFDTLVRLDGKAGLAHLTEHIINFADFVLVLQVNTSH